jgi:hypothetical protein
MPDVRQAGQMKTTEDAEGTEENGPRSADREGNWVRDRSTPDPWTWAARVGLSAVLGERTFATGHWISAGDGPYSLNTKVSAWIAVTASTY